MSKIKWEDVKVNDIIEIEYIDKIEPNQIIFVSLVTNITKTTITFDDILCLTDPDNADRGWILTFKGDIISNYTIKKIITHIETPKDILKKTHPEYFI